MTSTRSLRPTTATRIRRGASVALATAAIAAALAPAANASSSFPVVTLETNGTTHDVSGGFGCFVDAAWPVDPAHPGGPLCADPPPDVRGIDVDIPGYPFDGVLHFGQPPSAVTARTIESSGGEGTAATVAQLDVDSWSISLAGPHPSGTRLSYSARYAFRPDRTGISGERWNVFQLRLPPAVVDPTRPPTAAEQAPSVVVLGARRRGGQLVVRVQTNTRGTLRAFVRQGAGSRRWRQAGLAAGRHRIVVRLPESRRGGGSVVLRLTDEAGRSVRLAHDLN